MGSRNRYIPNFLIGCKCCHASTPLTDGNTGIVTGKIAGETVGIAFLGKGDGIAVANFIDAGEVVVADLPYLSVIAVADLGTEDDIAHPVLEDDQGVVETCLQKGIFQSADTVRVAILVDVHSIVRSFL